MNAIFTAFQDVALKPLAAQARRRALALASGRSGGLLLETVIAVSLMTIVGTAVLSGLSTTHISGAKTERQSIGENIARNQMAHLFSQTYDATLTWNTGNAYTPCPDCVPGGYAVYTDTKHSDPDCDPDSPTHDLSKPVCIYDPLDPNYDGSYNADEVQKVVVRVEFEGSQVFELKSLKVK